MPPSGMSRSIEAGRARRWDDRNKADSLEPFPPLFYAVVHVCSIVAMTVITSGRRCNPFSIPAISLAFLIVFGLYIWSVKLEERLSSVLHQGTDDSQADGLGVADENVKLDWNLGGTEAGSVAVQAQPPPELGQNGIGAETVPANLDNAAIVPNDGSRMMAHETGPSEARPSEDSAVDPQIADTWKSPSTQSELVASLPFDCVSLPGAKDVLLVMKTGATEVLGRLPLHLLTTFTCVPDYLIFSSLSQNLGHVQIHDALANISDTYKSSDETLRTLYPKLKEFYHKGWDMSFLAPQGAWDLDKWKNVPMALESYRMYPDKKWFVFMDADSAIMWSNLLHLLSRLNAEEPFYLGSPVYIGDTQFAHGGSGYIVSGAALQKLAEIEAGKKTAWEERNAQVCCGDQMFAETLRDAGVGLTSLVPGAYGGTPRTVLWTTETWCKAPVFFHHMGLEEQEELWSWEQSWLSDQGRAQPMLFGDMFYHFVGQYLLSTADNSSRSQFPPEELRMNWSNMASGTVFSRPDPSSPEALAPGPEAIQPYASADACREQCLAVESCLQWLWAPDQCVLGEVPALGRTPRTKWDQGGGPQMDNMVSGWVKERIAYYIGRFGECPEGSEF